jgi:hypothetical protein
VDLAESLLASVGTTTGAVAIEAPGSGPGFWAGGPSAIFSDGAYWLAYRLRRPVDQGRGYANVVARSEDGITFTTVATVTSEQFECASLERPALVRLRDGGWRLYVSCSTWNSKHWWVEAIEAATPEALATGTRTVVLPGDAATAWKDVVVHDVDGQWQIWACRHPLDGGDDEADRMSTWFGTSEDGLAWSMAGPALLPTPGTWDARGARLADVVRLEDSWLALYDGRASTAENWRERTGIALGTSGDKFSAALGPTPQGEVVRYVSVVERPEGYRLYWEASRPDGAHDLRTANVPRPASESQSS